MYQSGQLFYDRYELLAPLGRGGFSEVWKAKDTKSDVILAIKIFIKQDEEGVKLCKAEYQKTHSLNHPNILTPVFFDEYEGAPFLVMPFCSGGTIADEMGKLNKDNVEQLIHQIGSALEYLHSRTNPIVHSDIKPDNILVDEEGNFLLTDFGISEKLQSKLNKTLATQGIAPDVKMKSGITPLAYRAPELFFFKGQPATSASEKTDIWGFGACLYQIATNNLPFNGEGGITQKIAKAQGHENTAELIGPFPKNLLPGVTHLIQQCLQLEPWSRPTAKEIANWNINKAPKSSIVKIKKLPPTPVQTTENPAEATANTEKKFPLTWVYIGLGSALLLVIFLSIWVTANAPDLDATATTMTTDSTNMSFLSEDNLNDSLNLWTVQARECLDNGDLVAPETHSAYFFTKKTLAQDPYHEPSLRLEMQIADQLAQLGLEAYEGGNYQTAIQYLENSLMVMPDNSYAERLLESSREALIADATPQTAPSLKNIPKKHSETPSQKEPTKKKQPVSSISEKKDTPVTKTSKPKKTQITLTRKDIDAFFSGTIYLYISPTKTISSLQEDELKNEEVTFKLANSLTINQQTILPKGTLFSGEIATIHDFTDRKVKRRNSIIKIKFDEITVPGKKTISILKGILKVDNEDSVRLKPTGSYLLELDGERETALKNYVLSFL